MVKIEYFLVTYCIKQGLSQEKLADKAGLCLRTIHHIENG
jgi:DNA-binding XRE family transcriptional regulator